jgi:hypothetical protein
METFDYISVMISIVLGLGIANILNTVGILIRNKNKVIHSSTFYIHCTFLILLMFQAWWTVFGYRDYPDWNFFFYLLILVLISLIYLMTEMLKVKEGLDVIDLETTFLRNKTLYLLIFIASVFCGGIIQSIVTGSSIFTNMNIFRGLIISFGFWGVFSSSSKVQKLVAVAFLVIFVVIIVVYRLNIGELSQ